MTNFLSGDENIYRRMINADDDYYRRKIFDDSKISPFLKFSKTCSGHYFSLKRHKNIDHPACKYTDHQNDFDKVTSLKHCINVIVLGTFDFLLYYTIVLLWLCKDYFSTQTICVFNKGRENLVFESKTQVSPLTTSITGNLWYRQELTKLF